MQYCSASLQVIPHYIDVFPLSLKVDYAASRKYPDFIQEAVPETLHKALMDFIDQKPYQPTEQLNRVDKVKYLCLAPKLFFFIHIN